MNASSILHQAWAARAKRSRFSPISNLKPDQLTRLLDAFDSGHLRDAANLWDQLEQRDDLLRSVISKRKKSVARHGWAVLPIEGLAPSEQSEAARHIEALEFFYKHLQCDHAVDTNEQGGFKLLARQMMDAVGKRFAVHEIVWKVIRSSGSEPRLSAKFRFVPLSFFENTTGELRFLQAEHALQGQKLEPGAWMITVGDGLMIASSIAWLIKHLTLNDWLEYSQRTGIPILRGITNSPRGSTEWEDFRQAMLELAQGVPVLHGAGDDIDVLDLGGGKAIPFPLLAERMDRMMAVLWRGADLSTISRDRGYGASLQEKETCALEEDDAHMLTETLNRYVDRWVIRHLFGRDVEPLARVHVLVTPRECTTTDLHVDDFLLRHGAPLDLEETMNRYGRKPAPPGQPTLQSGSIASKPQPTTLNHTQNDYEPLNH